jgi:hypothetical protein
MVKKAERKKRRSRKDVASSVETKNPELVFGIVGPIGVDIDSVIKALEDALRGVDYEPLTIHLTSEMDHPRVPTRIDHSSYYARYMSLIKKANEYRRKAKEPGCPRRPRHLEHQGAPSGDD